MEPGSQLAAPLGAALEGVESGPVGLGRLSELLVVPADCGEAVLGKSGLFRATVEEGSCSEEAGRVVGETGLGVVTGGRRPLLAGAGEEFRGGRAGTVRLGLPGHLQGGRGVVGGKPSGDSFDLGEVPLDQSEFLPGPPGHRVEFLLHGPALLDDPVGLGGEAVGLLESGACGQDRAPVESGAGVGGFLAGGAEFLGGIEVLFPQDGLGRNVEGDSERSACLTGELFGLFDARQGGFGSALLEGEGVLGGGPESAEVVPEPGDIRREVGFHGCSC